MCTVDPYQAIGVLLKECPAHCNELIHLLFRGGFPKPVR